MDTPQLEVQTDFPCSFQCTSGEFLFGQMQCIMEGMKNTSHDGMNGPTLLEQGGTIVQHDFNHRVAARVGRWTVSRIYLGNQDQPGSDTYTANRWLIGYVAHHEDVSPVEYVLRAAKVGISNHNDHADKAIVYVNRYDWSWHHGERTEINIALGPGHPYPVSQVKDLMAGRLIVVDASQAQTFIDTIRNSYPKRVCYSLRTSSNAVPYGVHLDTAGNHPTYELGWLGFSGKKHEKFTESDELVAIVYDPAYVGFSSDYMDPDRAVMMENTVVVTGASLRQDTGNDVEEADEDYVLEEASEGESDSSEGSSPGGLEENELVSLALPDTLPPPAITGVVPKSGLSVHISGTTLGQTTSVLFGDATASFKVKSNTLVEASAPAGISGQVDVKVLGPGGTSNAYTYTHPAVATITSINPTSGSRWGGDTVTISGYNLDQTTKVTFGFQPAIAFEIISATEIKATTPAGPGGPSPPYSQEVTIESTYEVFKGSYLQHQYYIYLRDAPLLDPEYTVAIATWRAAIGRHPDDIQAREYLDEVFEQKGDKASRIGVWKEALDLEPNNPKALDNLAAAYTSDAQYSEAIEAWKAAIEAGADEEHIFLGLADAYEKIGDEEQSVHMRNEAARLWPEREDSYF